MQRIEYKDNLMTIRGIAKKEELNPTTLKKYYIELGDIYKAVEAARANSLQKIQYYKDELSIYAISEKENIGRETLRRWYYKTDENIYEAVKICKVKKNKQGKVPLVSRENISEIYKKIKKQVIEMNDLKINTYDLSLLIGVKRIDLVNLLNAGLSVEKIKEMYGNAQMCKYDILKESVNNKVNVSFLYRAIETYGRDLQESIKIYEIKNSIPQTWIQEKYSQILRRLPEEDVKWILYFMQCEYLSLDEAIEKQALTEFSELYQISEEWGETLYAIAKGRELLGEGFNSGVKLTDKEQQFINSIGNGLKKIRNQISQNIDNEVDRD